ncbi:hypothetical protein KR52_09875 [Synechococcus sp. KORDI-52]|uniref:UPF0182 family protein n=1 Tax=Synechococcus sp. KORDI-52 TaxID=585425 RepID=UPI0004E099C0|nr:UPF0182 family protein [Synechococcus sp. KORDI-52]AII49447.1 hypothetical protein KR52_09875 [Synechococcus sp. KORDI-52]
MRRLLLLLPLVVFAARMQIEWLWFEQFEWTHVLLKRWLLQLLFAGLAMLPLLAARLWCRQFREQKPSSSQGMSLSGWSYGAALTLCSAAVLISGLLTLDLLALAIRDPFELGDWDQHLWPHQRISTVAMLIQAGGIALAMGWPRLRPWLARIVAGSLVVVVSRAWGIWSLALWIPDQGLDDPLLGTDLSFGLGRFAGLHLALELWVLGATFTLCFELWCCLARSKAVSDWTSPAFAPRQVQLIRSLSALLVLGLAGLVWLSRHQLLWTQHGLVAGAGWLQEHLTLPFRAGTTLLLVLIALALLFPCRRRLRRGLVVTLASLLALEMVATPLTRWLVVRPQEINLQSRYLTYAIDATRRGFQLDLIKRQVIEPQTRLSETDLDQGASTLENVRLWDSAPLLEANRQLQQLRVYYRFSNAAVDRYPLNQQSDSAQQVILSARELDQSALPRRSRTWQNRHFIFTHGYGFTVSPVNERSYDGLPSYFISDLGTDTRITGNEGLGIDRSEVEQAIPVGDAALYYGMLPSPYAVVPTQIPEFDYPEGDLNVMTHYRGSGGVSIGSWLQRCAAAVYLRELRLLTTSAINTDSKILIRREVRSRVAAIAPFIDFRGDPYLISIPNPPPGFMTTKQGDSDQRNQHQYWVVEGYTHSSTLAYSAAVSPEDPDRYLRNSVKAIVDAYNGSVRFFISEPQDPIVIAWNRAFPGLFEPMQSMPSLVRDHRRVPEDFFNVQVSQLKRYHVEDPRVFYSGDDVWQVPSEIYGGQKVDVEPYHVTAQLQDNTNSEFLLLQPLTPLERPNLTAWLAARNDGDHYGQLELIDFPKDKNILGPEQVQALIHQDPEVSKVFGLWDQGDLELVQGNLLVLPVGSALLYVEPVYLRTSKVGLPSLARIVVSDGRSIAMDQSLSLALDQLMKKAPPV